MSFPIPSVQQDVDDIVRRLKQVEWPDDELTVENVRNIMKPFEDILPKSVTDPFFMVTATSDEFYDEVILKEYGVLATSKDPAANFEYGMNLVYEFAATLPMDDEMTQKFLIPVLNHVNERGLSVVETIRKYGGKERPSRVTAVQAEAGEVAFLIGGTIVLGAEILASIRGERRGMTEYTLTQAFFVLFLTTLLLNLLWGSQVQSTVIQEALDAMVTAVASQLHNTAAQRYTAQIGLENVPTRDQISSALQTDGWGTLSDYNRYRESNTPVSYRDWSFTRQPEQDRAGVLPTTITVGSTQLPVTFEGVNVTVFNTLQEAGSWNWEHVMSTFRLCGVSIALGLNYLLFIHSLARRALTAPRRRRAGGITWGLLGTDNAGQLARRIRFTGYLGGLVAGGVLFPIVLSRISIAPALAPTWFLQSIWAYNSLQVAFSTTSVVENYRLGAYFNTVSVFNGALALAGIYGSSEGWNISFLPLIVGAVEWFRESNRTIEGYERVVRRLGGDRRRIARIRDRQALEWDGILYRFVRNAIRYLSQNPDADLNLETVMGGIEMSWRRVMRDYMATQETVRVAGWYWVLGDRMGVGPPPQWDNMELRYRYGPQAARIEDRPREDRPQSPVQRRRAQTTSQTTTRVLYDI